MTLVSLLLLWLAYGLVGWQLSINYIFGFIGIAAVVAAIVLAWPTSPWLSGAFGYLPQVLVVASAISLLIAVTAVSPILITLLVIPLLTTFLAWQEMQALALKINVWGVLIATAILGLGVGELIDLSILPSYKG
jgi:hypothetical protein